MVNLTKKLVTVNNGFFYFKNYDFISTENASIKKLHIKLHLYALGTLTTTVYPLSNAIACDNVFVVAEYTMNEA